MSQAEILDILDHPMTAREIVKLLPDLHLTRAKNNLTAMRKNRTVKIVGKIGRAHIYERAA